MRSSLQGSAALTHANPVRSESDGLTAKTTRVRSLANSVEKAREPRKSAALARESMRSVDLSQKAFALACGQAESVVSEGLHGTRNLAFDWLDAQDDVFVLDFCQRWLQSRNLTPQNQRAARVKLAATLFQTLIDLAEEA
jgi:hypothetical protein